MSETTEPTRKGLTAEGLDAVWSMIVHSWSIETREFFEREGPIEFAGPRDATPLMKAIHHTWKRDPKVAPLVAELATLTAQVAEHERTIKSLSVMLGWENVPPQATLEASIRTLNRRVAEQAQEIERLNEKQFTMSVRAGRTEASDMASLAFLRRAKAAEAKLRAVEALIAEQRKEAVRLFAHPENCESKRDAVVMQTMCDTFETAILTPEAQQAAKAEGSDL